MIEEPIFIHKVDPEKYRHMDELFVINSSNRIYQTYAGVYDISAIMDIIRGYTPSIITIYCANFHARDIVKFIVNIQVLKYNLSVKRFIFRNNNIHYRIILLQFRMS